MAPRFTNRLAHETSPYLLQHAHNPVDWYPWGPEALAKARSEDKPILLSVGYSACHWCHVMEHESFEDEQVAELMNKHFVNIKVDREERPDLDSIYMNFVQMTTGSGGWPMTVFMTADQVPFYGGTYFPREDSYGRTGFKRLLGTIADYYENRREELLKHRSEILDNLEKMARSELPAGALSSAVLDSAYRHLTSAFDPTYGGFGSAPKFPSAMNLGFLLRYGRRTKAVRALEMVELTLEKMGQGGIYDQLGGGFHRYSVDARWLVPHFEKMLYDNALLARVYLEAYQLTGKPLYRRVVEETLYYVRREMTSPQGGFYSAQDADSEGVEGKFFVWTPAEIRKVLGEEDGEMFCRLYDVTESGNFEHWNILNIARDFEVVAKLEKRALAEIEQGALQARARLFQEREKRVKPGRDDKILTAWNGLMLAAFAQAGRVLGDKSLLEMAARNASFVLDHLFIDGRLQRSYKDGRARFNAYVEDYAQLIEGLVHLYMATFELRWLRQAQKLLDTMIDLFWDKEGVGFFFTASDHEKLVVRQKDFYDNATPSGNSAATHCLLLMAELTGKSEYHRLASRSLEWVSQALGQFPTGFGYWLQALEFHQGPIREIALAGNHDDALDELVQAVYTPFVPNKIVALATSEAEKVVPFLKDKSPQNGKATAYVCENFSCKQPVTDGSELIRQLEA